MIIDLEAVSMLDRGSAEALRQGISETRQRRIITVIAATRVDARLPLVRAEIDRLAPVRFDVAVSAVLQRTISI